MKRKIGILLLMTLVTMCICNLSTPEPDVDSQVTKVKMDVVELEEQGTALHQQYQEGMTWLIRENDSLMAVIKARDLTLEDSRQELTAMEWKLRKLVRRQELEKDTAKKLIKCDSLKEQVTVLIQKHEEKDSLYEKTITDQNLLLANKDSTICLNERSYNQMKALLDTSLSQQRDLAEKFYKWGRKLRRKVIINRILSAGLILVTGVTATLLLEK